MGLNHNLNHYWLKEIKANSIETFTPIPQSFLHGHISYYNVYVCIVNVIALLIPCFYEGFDNSSSV